jgi:hypothetical protein
MTFSLRKFALMLAGIGAASIPFAACGDNGGPAASATSGAAPCLAGSTQCGDTCVDTDSDNLHCGACDAACATGEACIVGKCEKQSVDCPAPFVTCGGACVDPKKDHDFCGASSDCAGANAGVACQAGELCAMGTCVADCAAGQVSCGGACVDPKKDHDFCGAAGDCAGANAGVACQAGELCSFGVCALSCQTGLVQCGSTCVNPKNDPSFCGASSDCAGANAGTVCGQGEACVNGACVLECPPNMLFCDGKCVDAQHDPLYCGASSDCAGANKGTVCGQDELCANGACDFVCPGGLVECPGNACVDGQNDPAHCGATLDCMGGNAGVICGASEACVNGACTVTCPVSQVLCNGLCINPATDEGYCGATLDCSGANAGSACGAGEACVAGSCAPTSVVFDFAGQIESYTVPAGVTKIYIQAAGAQGANGSGPAGGSGGLGGLTVGFVDVVPGDVLDITVGGAGVNSVGGFNGGGNGGSTFGGGGGGKTVVAKGATTLFVAPGGGGGGATGCDAATQGGAGGPGGAVNQAGSKGGDTTTGNGVAGGGFGGTLDTGGLKGVGCAGFSGQDGTVPDGGKGQTCCCFNSPRTPGGGGGGAGYVAGGGGGGGSAGTVSCNGNDKGAGGGGSGGAAFIDASVSNSTTSDGARAGNGRVTIIAL